MRVRSASAWLPVLGAVLAVACVHRRRSRPTAGRLLAEGAAAVQAHLREGRFQRSLSLVAGLSSVLAGAEVAYEHYRGSYGNRLMYTPVILSGAMTITGVGGTFSRRVARGPLRWVSALTLVDGLVGFGFHVRGIARKPGGWRLPVENIIMGPPIFAPLLFGVSAYLGLMASFLRSEEDLPLDFSPASLRGLLGRGRHPWRTELREGRFQKHLAAVTLAGTFFSGFEALYSHYKNGFRYGVQWSPIVITPLLMGAAGAAIGSPRAARTWLPGMSLVAMLNGLIGFYYHLRGVLRRPGGLKLWLYNLVYGPPIFAPLLFAACGFTGLLASRMRRERP